MSINNDCHNLDAEVMAKRKTLRFCADCSNKSRVKGADGKTHCWCPYYPGNNGIHTLDTDASKCIEDGVFNPLEEQKGGVQL